MNIIYRRQFESAIAAVEISSATTYRWFGTLSPQLTRPFRDLLTDTEQRAFLHSGLKEKLYTNFYCRGIASRPVDIRGSKRRSAVYVAELSEANSGEGVLEAAGDLTSDFPRHLTVLRNGLRFYVREGEILAATKRSPTQDATVQLRLPKEFCRISPGHYLALGNVPLPSDILHPILRVYWAVTPRGALQLVKNTTSLLNEASIPFRLKVLNDPTSFGRHDAGVLYILRADYEEVFRLLNKIYSKMTTTDLTRDTPALVMQIADGLGVADDPGGGESFGLHRCHLLAEAIIRSEELKIRSLDEKIEVLEMRLLEAGVNPDKPYLGSGLEDIFAVKLNGSFGLNVPSPPKLSRRNSLKQISFLEVAVGIGRRLALEAVWSEDKCNWLAPTPLDPRDKSFGRTHGALGPELYSGTSGVAFLLAELDRLVDQPLLRRTARGAIKHALSNSYISLIKHKRLGLYTGVMGIVLVAFRLAMLWDDVELRAAALELAEYAITTRTRDVDLLSGRAGIIVALLTLYAGVGNQTYLSDAIALGDELISDAVRSAEGYSWNSAGRPRPQQNLTGLSHGAAGIGQCLLELFRGTKKLRYFEAAKLAFAYERHWFDSEEQNWPDFRQSARRRDRSPSFCAFWCHGAPGIALSRLRAYEILGSRIDKDEAEVALATTQQEVESWLYAHRSNYSLCHGLSGNLEVLLHGAEILAGQWIKAREIAEAAAKFGIETYFTTEEKWPCGTPLNDEIPSLMLGLAGIGYFYLRLADPSIPSILLIRSDRWIL